MPKLRTLEAGVLNVVIHPHSPGKYVDLLRETSNLRRNGKIQGSDHLLIGPYSTIKSEPTDGVYGFLYKFVNIDPSAPWLNLSSMEPAVNEDGEPINPVPPHLAPNLRTIPFVFFPTGHRLFFDRKYLSPLSASKAMYAIFNQPEIVQKFGEVSVNMEATDETIDQIKRIPALTKLNICVTLPNPDELSDRAQRVQERIRIQNAKKYSQEYTGSKDDGLKPDDESEAAMELALSNGHIDAEGWDGDEKVKESTRSHPKVIRSRYNPGTTTTLQFLATIGQNVLSSFTGRQ